MLVIRLWAAVTAVSVFACILAGRQTYKRHLVRLMQRSYEDGYRQAVKEMAVKNGTFVPVPDTRGQYPEMTNGTE